MLEIEKLKSFILDSESIKVRRDSDAMNLQMLEEENDSHFRLSRNEALLTDNLD